MFAVATKIDWITRQRSGDGADDLRRGVFALVKSTDTVEGRAIQRSSVEFQRACNSFAQVQMDMDQLPQALHDSFDRYWDNLMRAGLKY